MFTEEIAKTKKNDLKILYALIFVLATVILICLFYYFDMISSTETVEVVPEEETFLVLSEVCSCQSECTSNIYNEAFDWIEIYNPGNEDVDLSEYYLSDKADSPYKYRLPEISLGGHAYIMVYASGYDVYEAEEIHTNFKISSDGETILLSNNSGIVSRLTLSAMASNFTYGLGENQSVGFLFPATPMQANGPAYASEEDYFSFTCTPNGLYINEYMSSGQSVFHDEDGYYSDWVELINTTDTDISLAGYCLTDDPRKPNRFSLPDVVIAPQSTLLIFLDGKDHSDGTYFHANFSISTEDDSINLFDNNHALIDTVPVVETDDTISYGRSADDFSLWQYFSIPTPNQPNIFDGATDMQALFSDYANYVMISEVKTLSANQALYGDADWIELYNHSDETIDLSRFGLSDNKNALFKWVFPDNVHLAPHEYLLVIASGRNTVDTRGNYHTSFKLDGGFEDIYLTSNLGYIVDKMPARYIRSNHSFGKSASGESYLLKTPTPGKDNATPTYDGYANPVTFSHAPGVYSNSFSLTLTSGEPSADIYYTLDGTSPTKSAIQYTEPLQISQNTTVSAVAVVPGKLSSDILCHSYFLTNQHDLPIVIITTKRDYLYGSDGLLIHSRKETEIPANLEIIEPNHLGYLSFRCQLRLFGNSSLYAPQKSFAVEVDNEYTDNHILYDLFPGDTKAPDVFASFVIRNGGSSEWSRTKLTDGFLMNLARLGMNVDAQSYRPCAVYINGKYYGLLNLREKLNRDYIETHYGFDKETICIVEPISNGEYGAVQGSVDEFMTMVEYIRKHDISNPANYRYIESQLDIDNYIDSLLAHIICGNKDTGNIKFWKSNAEGTKWRVFLFDLDRAAYYPTSNHLLQRTAEIGHGSGNLFDTSIIRGLLENETFSAKFYKRAIELMDTLYSPEFAIAYYDYLAANITDEMENNLDLWWEYCYNDATTTSAYGTPPKTRGNAKLFIANEQDRHRNFFKNRQAYALKQFKSYFGLSDSDIEKLRSEIAAENKAPTQIYNVFIETGSIEEAIAFANQLDTVFLDFSE
ncbi:MAG: lamin tail domain-containing protein [Eubacteriales bacterium]